MRTIVGWHILTFLSCHPPSTFPTALLSQHLKQPGSSTYCRSLFISQVPVDADLSFVPSTPSLFARR